MKIAFYLQKKGIDTEMYNLLKWLRDITKYLLVSLLLLLFAVIMTAYFSGKIGSINLGFIESLIALFSTFVIFLQLIQNKDIEEAKLIEQINIEFIENVQLSKVERKLEKYYSQYKRGKKKEEIILELSMEDGSKERQWLVNYLVHLEAVATLVNNRDIHLKAITDLVAYRFFIAVNNPVVQCNELCPFKDYYQGCYDIYEKWFHTLKKKGKEIPLEEYRLKNRG